MCAVGERGRCIDVYASGVHLPAEPFGTCLVVRNDAFAMFGTVLPDMCQCFLERIHGFNGHLVVQELSAVAVFSGKSQQLDGIFVTQTVVGGFIGKYLYIA